MASQLAERAGARCLAADNEPEPEPNTGRAPAGKEERLVFDRLARTTKDLTITIFRLDAGVVPDAPAPEPPERDDWPTQTDPRRPCKRGKTPGKIVAISEQGQGLCPCTPLGPRGPRPPLFI